MLEQPPRNPVRDFLSGGIDDGKQNAVFLRKDPAAIFVACFYFVAMIHYGNGFVMRWQQHPMIQLVDNFLSSIAEGDEPPCT